MSELGQALVDELVRLRSAQYGARLSSVWRHLGGVMQVFALIAKLGRAMSLGLSVLCVTGCSCLLTEPTYRFELAFDAAPAAYRNVGAANEPLVVAMRVRNLGAGNLCISGPATERGVPEGLTVLAKAITPNPYLRAQQADVSYGLRAGKVLKDVDHAADAPLFDKHNAAVRDLAEAAPPLLGLDQDRVLTTYRLLGNETMVLLTFPVSWLAVPETPLVVDSALPIEIMLGYRGPDGKVSRFNQTFRHRLPVHLINTVRGHSNLRPGADGPKTGSFEPTAPNPAEQ